MLTSRKLKVLLCKIFPFINIYLIYRRIKDQYSISQDLNYTETTQIGYPFLCTNPKNVYLEENTRINPGCKIIIHTGRFFLKKYSFVFPWSLCLFPFSLLQEHHLPSRMLAFLLQRNMRKRLRAQTSFL